MKLWSERDIEILQNNYQHLNYVDLAELLNRSEAAVRNKVYQMGLRKRPDFWTEEEIILLTNHYSTNEIVDLDKLEELFPGRKKSNISRKAREFGLTKQGRAKTEKTKRIIGEKAKERIKIQGHPKGFLGHHHTKSAKKKISEKSKEMWQDPDFIMNTDEYRNLLSDRAINNNLAGHRNRYSSGRIGKRDDLGGLFVRSSWEANYARYLNWLQQIGEIVSWEYEPDTYWFEEIKQGTRSYTPDFKIHLKDGSFEYHEVKGWMDQKSKTKLKRMEKYYPNTKIVLIDKEAYYSLQRDVKNLIDNWE